MSFDVSISIVQSQLLI